MIAGLNVEFQACRLADCNTKASVHAARTYARARQNHRSILTRISPLAPCWDTWSARWHSKIFQFGMPKVPAPASNDVVTEKSAISVEHIVCGQRVDIVRGADGSDRTRETWSRWRIKQAKGIEDR